MPFLTATAILMTLSNALAQTVTIVGTPHLTGLETVPTAEQYAHTVSELSAFRPTQVCVERMSGERVQWLSADPARNAMTLKPQTHGRPLADTILPLGAQMQVRLAVHPADARDRALELASRWSTLNVESRVRVIGLLVAGYEFHSAVLNWSYLDGDERRAASALMPDAVVDALESHLRSSHEVYALAVPLARRAGLHVLCSADSLEFESAGMQVAMANGGDEILANPKLTARFDEYLARIDRHWQPGDGVDALTRLLAFVNSQEFAELDREMQWETLLQFDNDSGAFRRRIMFWHARTARITSELFRALAEGPDERVMLIIGAAHRSFNEAGLQSQPWIKVAPAIELLESALEVPD